jgi:hypothetical protein
VLGIESGKARRSSPSMASTSKAPKLDFLVLLAATQRVEVGAAVNTEDHGFT